MKMFDVEILKKRSESHPTYEFECPLCGYKIYPDLVYDYVRVTAQRHVVVNHVASPDLLNFETIHPPKCTHTTEIGGVTYSCQRREHDGGGHEDVFSNVDVSSEGETWSHSKTIKVQWTVVD